MTKEELLRNLYTAERDINAFYPAAQNELQLRDHKKNLEQILANEEDNKREKTTKGIMYLVFGVIFFVLFGMDFLLHELMIFFAVPAVVMGLFQFLGVANAKKEIAKSQQMIQETDVAMANSQKYIAYQSATLEGLAIYRSMMPTECIHPQYARQFISYIETDQALTLPDARKLFAEFLYREKMTSLASEQLAATKNAEAAMIMAASQAANAAAAAQNAANAAYYAGQAANHYHNP